MIAVVCFDLLPEALGPGDTGSCFAGIFLAWDWWPGWMRCSSPP